MKAIIGSIVDPTVIKDGFRRIKLRWLGRNALRDVIHAKEPGTDTNPHPSTKMLILKTLDPKEDVAMLCVDDSGTREDLKEGEKAFYSYDADGNPMFIVTIRGDKMEIGTAPDGTEPANFVTKFTEMQTAFDELKGEVNVMIQEWNIFAAAYVPGSPATTGLPATANTVTLAAADMSGAKSEEILIN